jgi:FlaA1/EpsC-like NDP-sugar epimerase
MKVKMTHRLGGRPQVRLTLAACGAFALAYILAFLLRFDFKIIPPYDVYLWRSLGIAVLAKLAVFYGLGTFRIVWAYVGIRDSFRILRATVLASAVNATLSFLIQPLSITTPRSILLIDGLLTFLFVSGIFVSLRLVRESLRRPGSVGQEPVFVVGAGDAGDRLVRDMSRSAGPARAVAFLDDDPRKLGRVLQGIPVAGRVADASLLAGQYRVKTAYVAIPSLPPSALRRMVSELTTARLSIKVLPPLAQLMSSGSMVPQVRELALEDLLRREPVRPDSSALAAFIRGKVVLVTGAAGSIGSEICRQVLTFEPSRLVALDCAETPLHDLTLELLPLAPRGTLIFRLVDVTDPSSVGLVFTESRPDLVFHAAALKHVPVLETHPHRAVEVNVGGTRVVGEAAAACASTFVLISTDKAVRPTSVMGTTKRLAELLVRCLGRRPGVSTRYVSVRFGNVLGSNGSVVPIFRKQLARGGPLTVTHPEMRRYFMTIPEAVHLVLQAGALGQGGETFFLDMGEPVRIVDLAEDIIRLSGLEPGVDVKIEFTGIRPGEKLYEELRMDSENMAPTRHPKVFQLRSESADSAWSEIVRIEAMAQGHAPADELLAGIRGLVPDYHAGPRPSDADPDADPEATTVAGGRG